MASPSGLEMLRISQYRLTRAMSEIIALRTKVAEYERMQLALKAPEAEQTSVAPKELAAQPSF